MKLYLYKRQFRLQYGRVLYSDGTDYFPFRLAFSKIKKTLLQTDNVLVLGSGIGSVGMMLHQAFPDKKWEMTFVDISKPVLSICESVMHYYPNIHPQYIVKDAVGFAQEEASTKYNLICVDVFDEDTVPESIFKPSFIKNLQRQMQSKAKLVMNIMYSTEMQKAAFEMLLNNVFGSYECLQKEQNYIYLLSK